MATRDIDSTYEWDGNDEYIRVSTERGSNTIYVTKPGTNGQRLNVEKVSSDRLHAVTISGGGKVKIGGGDEVIFGRTPQRQVAIQSNGTEWQIVS